MPLMNPHNQSITQRNRALELFTDRFTERRLFTQYLNEETPREKILFFHGDGGNGKSLLLDILERDYCHRIAPNDWQSLKTIQSNQQFLEAFVQAKSMTKIPSARLDFGAREMGDDRPREDWSALLMLRRGLGSQGFHFPTFDFGITLFLHKTRQLGKAKLTTLFPQEESDLAAALIDLVTEGVYANLAWKVIGLFDNTFLERLTLFRQKRGLSNDLVEGLIRMDPQGELRDELPHLLSRDLNASLQIPGAPSRVVLFFDTHEAFWGHERSDLPAFSYFQQDEWLRRFLGECFQPNHGVVAVVAGREAPRWADQQMGNTRIDQTHIDTQLIGQLSREDATDYLSKIGITDQHLIDNIATFAEVERNQIHPLFLGLCADVILEAEKQGQHLKAEEFSHLPRTGEKGQELINRLLKYCTPNVRAAVEALAASRTFDLPVYMEVGRALHLQVSAPDFKELIKFSFIREETNPKGTSFHIHALLRRVLAQIAPEAIQAAHKALEAFYQTKAEVTPFAIIEQIYHSNQQDWKRGYLQWIDAFDRASEKAQYGLCEALVALRSLLIIENHTAWGQFASCAGHLFTVLSRHKTAEQAYKEALDFFEQTLKIDPENVQVLSNKGAALLGLGELQAVLAQHAPALATFQQAILTCEQALALAPEFVLALVNKGAALLRLGERQAALAQHAPALATFQQAILTYEQALALGPENVRVLSNKGLAYRKLAETYIQLTKTNLACSSLQEADRILKKALSFAPNAPDMLQERQTIKDLRKKWCRDESQG